MRVGPLNHKPNINESSDHLLVPRGNLLVDGVLHVLTHLCRDGNKGEIGLWVESEGFEERSNLCSDLVEPVCQLKMSNPTELTDLS
jgi:hypothetical protein